MPRHKTKSLQRSIPADRRYGSVLVQRLINKSLTQGKKQLAERQVYLALDLAAQQVGSKEEPLAVFETAIKNLYPQFEVKSRRVGGANYQIPFAIQGGRQQHFAFTWLVAAARQRNGMPYARALAAEIVDAYNKTGTAFKKKEDTHKMAEANRAFAHFARS
ncbi:MAG: 30S ribosomal protein S7 [Candidatus Chaera renei]|uniref:Small ribosomal subunit protein uS7 n=1 Tax=Candidatus Chaera renei TaxID=2506947 RepID=A0A4Q0AFS7_9BACT|nr:MAG: 30S ribosomal protein S7 [Candidatus Chaera renei]